MTWDQTALNLFNFPHRTMWLIEHLSVDSKKNKNKNSIAHHNNKKFFSGHINLDLTKRFRIGISNEFILSRFELY